MNGKIIRLGEEIINKYGTKQKIIEYISFDNIKVLCDNKYIVNSRYDTFKRKQTISPYDKFILGIGYLGEGKYKTKENGRDTFIYNEWHSMLSRCYNENQKNLIKNISYKNKKCTVCEEWHNFQNFAEWYENNIYNVNNENMRLDKDILFKGNTIYSPNNCIIVPERINNLFTYSKSNRGNYPIGVHLNKKTNKLRAECSIYDKTNKKSKNKHLGYYNTPEEAFNVYKEFKEQYIKQVADEYKDKIPKKLYDAMYRYEVEITD